MGCQSQQAAEPQPDEAGLLRPGQTTSAQLAIQMLVQNMQHMLQQDMSAAHRAHFLQQCLKGRMPGKCLPQLATQGGTRHRHVQPGLFTREGTRLKPPSLLPGIRGAPQPERHLGRQPLRRAGVTARIEQCHVLDQRCVPALLGNAGHLVVNRQRQPRTAQEAALPIA